MIIIGILSIVFILFISIIIVKFNHQDAKSTPGQNIEGSYSSDDIKRALVRVLSEIHEIDMKMGDEELMKLLQEEEFKRITKAEAKKLISQGEQVLCAPTKSLYDDSASIYLRCVPLNVDFNKFCNSYKRICYSIDTLDDTVAKRLKDPTWDITHDEEFKKAQDEESKKVKIAWFTSEKNLYLIREVK